LVGEKSVGDVRLFSISGLKTPFIAIDFFRAQDPIAGSSKTKLSTRGWCLRVRLIPIRKIFSLLYPKQKAVVMPQKLKGCRQ